MSILNNNKKNYPLFLFYFFSIIFFTLFLNWNDTIKLFGKNNELDVNFFTSCQEIFNFADQAQSGGDALSYIRGAKRFLKEGFQMFVSGDEWWWAPGIPILYAMIYLIYSKTPFLLTLLIINSVFWALFFVHIIYLLIHLELFRNKKITVFIPLIVLLFPNFNYYYFWKGLMLSEPISTAVFFLGIIHILRIFVNRDLYKESILAGIFLVLSAYFRIQFDLVNLTLFIVTVFSLLTCFLARHFSFLLNFRFFLKPAIKCLLILIVIYVGATIPYRLYIKNWIVSAHPLDFMWELAWQKHPDDTGLNALTVLDPSKTTEFEKRKMSGEKISFQEYKGAGYNYILNHPIKFILYKVQFLIKNFMFDHFYYMGSTMEKGNYIFIFLLSLMCLTFFFLPKLIVLPLFIFYSAFFVGTTGFSFIFHFEPRYLYPLKVMILFSSMFLLPYLCQEILRRIKDFKKRKLCLY